MWYFERERGGRSFASTQFIYFKVLRTNFQASSSLRRSRVRLMYSVMFESG